MRFEYISSTAQDTTRLGRLLALELQNTPGPRQLLLYGDPGCGKTTLIRGLVETLPGGEQAEASSPSFTICNDYPTRPRVIHVDLYRLGPRARLPEEALEPEALLAVEWSEYFPDADLAADRVELRLAFPPDPDDYLDIPGQACENKRLAIITGHGPEGEKLVKNLAARLLDLRAEQF